MILCHLPSLKFLFDPQAVLFCTVLFARAERILHLRAFSMALRFTVCAPESPTYRTFAQVTVSQ